MLQGGHWAQRGDGEQPWASRAAVRNTYWTRSCKTERAPSPPADPLPAEQFYEPCSPGEPDAFEATLSSLADQGLGKQVRAASYRQNFANWPDTCKHVQRWNTSCARRVSS